MVQLAQLGPILTRFSLKWTPLEYLKTSKQSWRQMNSKKRLHSTSDDEFEDPTLTRTAAQRKAISRQKRTAAQIELDRQQNKQQMKKARQNRYGVFVLLWLNSQIRWPNLDWSQTKCIPNGSGATKSVVNCCLCFYLTFRSEDQMFIHRRQNALQMAEARRNR